MSIVVVVFNMKKHIRSVQIFALTLGAVAVYFLVNHESSLQDKALTPVVTASQMDEQLDPQLESNRPADQEYTQEERQYEDFVRDLWALLELYRPDIDQVWKQVELIEVRDFVLSVYGLSAGELFSDAINIIYPEESENILKSVVKMDQYNQWYHFNRAWLDELDIQASHDTVWDKREDLFGKDAHKIWSGKMTPYEARKQKLRAQISEIGKSTIIGNDEKLYQLKESLSNVYSLPIESIGVNHDLVSRLFFKFDSVQQELKSLDDENRQLRIDDIRRQVGYSEADIIKRRDRDQVKHKRWENGLRYMAHREELEGQMDGPELDQALQDLRESYFKHEAKTITSEEARGFYRYRRTRLFGLN